MATVNKDKVQIEIEINGKQVKNTLADLDKSYKQLNREIRQLTPGTEEFNKKALEIAKAKQAIDSAKKSIQSFGQATEQAANEAQGLTGKLTALPAKISSGFRAMLAPIAGILAGIGIKQFLGDLFRSAAQMEAFEQKAKTVFGESLDTVETFAARNANAMGMTRQEYVATAAAAGDLLIPMGFQREEAAQLSTDLVNLSGALAEWSGGQKNAQEVSDILTKALLGEREQLKTLGIAIQEADVQQRLLEKGQKDLTGTALQQAKALATLELIMEKSTDAQEAYQNNTASLLRQQAQWRAYFQDLSDGFVKSVTPAIREAAGWFGDLLGVGDRYSDQLEQERIQLNALVLQITNANTPTEKRKELIEDLNEQYPDFLENLDQEKVTNEELTTRLKEVNSQLINRIVLQRQQEDIEKATTKAAEAKVEAFRKERALAEALVEASEKYGVVLDQNKTIYEQGQEAFEQLQLSEIGLMGIFDGRLAAQNKIGNLVENISRYTEKENKNTELSNKLQQERLALLERLNVELEANTEEEKKNTDRKKRRTQLTKEQIAALQLELEVERNIQRLRVEVMQEGEAKEIARLEQQAQEKIAALKGTAEQVAEQQKLIEQALEQSIQATRKKYRDQEKKDQEKAASTAIDQKKKQYEQELKQLEDFLKTSKQIEATQQALAAVQAGRDPKEVEQELKDALLQIELDFLEAKLALASKYGFDTLEIQKQIEDLRLGIVTDGVQREANERAKALKDFESKTSSVLQAVSQITAGIDQISQLSLETRLNNIEAAKKRELALVGDNEKKKAAIEAKFALQKEKAEQDAAKRQKKISAVQTVINTAESIVKTGAELGYPAAIPFQVIAAAIGLAQLQKINSQAFAAGGYTGDPGPGVRPDATGYKPAGIVHQGEWVAPAWMVQSPLLSPIISGLEGVRTQGTFSMISAMGFDVPNLSLTPRFDRGGMVPADESVIAAGMTAGAFAKEERDQLLAELKKINDGIRDMHLVAIWGENEASMNQNIETSLNNKRTRGMI